ncbi:hypothetical protein SDC9_188910 [bioreactor metagenome]|uniref:Uncharacterized protein n=1 Tax=bioreactor metagenome TaxID=1076179 RepID=A0A645HQM7_9ZZZZ
MVALVAAVGGLHLAQQGVHFVQRELAVGAHGTVAGHGGQDFIVCALHHGGGIVRGQFGQHAARQLHRIALRQAGGHGAHGQGLGGERHNLQAQRGQHLGAFFRRRYFLRRGGESGGDQQGLTGDARAALYLGLEAFVDDALVRGVHVHDDHALRVLGQDVDPVNLCHRPAQRPRRGFGGGQCWRGRHG